MGATGKKGKLKKGLGGTTFSTTGTKPEDWGIDPLKPYTSPDPTIVDWFNVHNVK